MVKMGILQKVTDQRVKYQSQLDSSDALESMESQRARVFLCTNSMWFWLLR